MAADSNFDAETVVSFGRFVLRAHNRLLQKDGNAVPLTGRALDILIALVERAGEIVGKRELLARVWPDVIVDEGSLRVHMVTLRKALADGEDSARYITNVPGRGYCFVAPISRSDPAAEASGEKTGPDLLSGVPRQPTGMIGRDEEVSAIREQLKERRFVTVVGAGGTGKTTVAVAVARASAAAFGNAVFFVDLGTLSSGALVGQSVAAALGMRVHLNDGISELVGFLRDRRMLLVLDSCEHIIDAVSHVAERVFAEAPGAYILATSREALRVDGESLFSLLPLACPPDEPGLMAAQVLSFPAIQLFLERVSAVLGGFVLTDQDAPIVADICRKLDGIPLAIEFTAGRIGAFGVNGTAALVKDHLELMFGGRRTAPARHQTLTAALDWSYNLLSEDERSLLRRLSVFRGVFLLEAAQAVDSREGIDPGLVIETVASLASKSLISADLSGKVARYRLLDTTRAYLFAKLKEKGELNETARSHALYYRHYLERYDTDIVLTDDGAPTVALNMAQADNVRSALEWSFSHEGDVQIGIALAAEAGSFFTSLLLWKDCQSWGDRARAALKGAARGTLQELSILQALGISSLFLAESFEYRREILERGFEVADTLDQPEQKLAMLEGLLTLHDRYRMSRASADLIAKVERDAHRFIVPRDRANLARSLGNTHHLLGNLELSLKFCEDAVAYFTAQSRFDMVRVEVTYWNRALMTMGQVMWLHGYPDRALAAIDESLEKARIADIPQLTFFAYMNEALVLMWRGEWQAALASVRKQEADTITLGMVPYGWCTLGLRGGLAIEMQDVETGVALLGQCMATRADDRHGVWMPMFVCALAKGLVAQGLYSEALERIDRELVEIGNNPSFYMPELLRVKGHMLTQAPNADLLEAENCFRQSLTLARTQAALSWELRTATSLARLLRSQERDDEARATLQPVYGKFTEGFETADLQAAQHELQGLFLASDSADSCRGHIAH